jgi:hypothetical protein
LIAVEESRPRDDQSPPNVNRVFEKHHVVLYRSDELPKVIDEIRRTGKEIAASGNLK